MSDNGIIERMNSWLDTDWCDYCNAELTPEEVENNEGMADSVCDKCLETVEV